MAATASTGLKQDQEPHPMHRLFWCVLLSLVPLTLIFIGADLNTIKTCAIVTGVPIIFVMIVMGIGWMKWMLMDYGSVSLKEIEEQSMLKPEKAEETK